MQRKFADSRKAAANEAAARRREDYMATQGRNIIGDGRNVSRIREARDNYKLNRPPRWDEKLGRNVAKKAEGVKTARMRGADLLASGIGAFAEGEKARVDGKFNAPLNVKYGTKAYDWLLDDVIKDEKDQDDFRREVAKGNLSWTELNKYADDEYIGGGQLARGINARNEGIIGTTKGKKAFTEATTIRKTDTPAIKEAIASAIIGGSPLRGKTAPLEAVTIEDINPFQMMTIRLLRTAPLQAGQMNHKIF